MQNVVFFYTINLSFMNTFFGTKTGPQYACELFETGGEDYLKFDAVFSVRDSFSKAINVQVEEWVKANIVRWKAEGEEWFKVEMIKDEFLPSEVLAAEGGAKRRRNSISFQEVLGLGDERSSSERERRRDRRSGRVAPVEE